MIILSRFDHVRYSILHRNWSKIHKLADNVYLLSSGMIADITALRQKLDETIKLYEFKMGKRPSLESCASLLCNLSIRFADRDSEDSVRKEILPLLHFQPSGRT